MGHGINLLDHIDEEFTSSELVDDSAISEAPKKRFSFSFGSSGAGMDTREQIRLLFTLLLAAGAYFGPHYYEETLLEQSNAKRQELSALQANVKKQEGLASELKAIREEMVEYDKRMDELRRKTKKVHSLNDNRNFIVRSVDFFVSQMPQDVWLSSLEIERGDGGTIIAEGFSSDLQSVSDFMKTLESAVFYPTWILESTSHESSGTQGDDSKISTPRDVKRFRIRANIVEPQT